MTINKLKCDIETAIAIIETKDYIPENYEIEVQDGVSLANEIYKQAIQCITKPYMSSDPAFIFFTKQDTKFNKFTKDYKSLIKQNKWKEFFEVVKTQISFFQELSDRYKTFKKE